MPLLCMMSVLGPLAIDMYLPAFPEIARSFGARGGAVELTLAAYLAGLCVGQIFLGPLADRFGRRNPLIVGMLLFALASVLCALAPSLEVLMAGRALQALGGGAGIVCGRAVVRDLCTPLEGAKALSLLMTMLGIGPILAPLVGSWLLSHGGWQNIFWLLGAYGFLCASMVALFLGETLDAAHVRPLRFLGVLKDYHIVLRHRVFLGYTLAGGLVMTGLFAYIAGAPFVLMELNGLSATQFSLVFSMNALGFVGTGVLNGHGVHHHGPFRQLRVGLVMALLASLVLVLSAWSGISLLPLLLCGLFFYVASIGFVNPNAGALALSAHGARAGTASAAMGTLQFAAAALVNGVSSALHDGTLRPLATVMFVSAGGAVLLYRWLAWPAERAARKEGH